MMGDGRWDILFRLGVRRYRTGNIVEDDKKRRLASARALHYYVRMIDDGVLFP